MKLEKPKLFDIVCDRKSLGFHLFQCEIQKIERKNFPLKKNYLEIDLDKFYCFTVLTNHDELVAFSGLQKAGPWNPKVARLSTRFYLAEKYQTKGMLAYKLGREYQSSYHTGSKYLNPFQVEYAHSIGLDGVFISREYPRKRRSLYEIARRCEFFDPRNSKYEVLPYLLNICPKNPSVCLNEDLACWQNIITVKFNEAFDLALPQMSLKEWFERFNTI